MSHYSFLTITLFASLTRPANNQNWPSAIRLSRMVLAVTGAQGGEPCDDHYVCYFLELCSVC